MKRIQYSLRRRDLAQGMRCRQQFYRDMLEHLKRKGILLLAVFAASVPLLLLMNVELRQNLEHKQQVVLKWIGLLATAMNGGVIYEKQGTQAYFFDKPTVVPLPEVKK